MQTNMVLFIKDYMFTQVYYRLTAFIYKIVNLISCILRRKLLQRLLLCGFLLSRCKIREIIKQESLCKKVCQIAIVPPVSNLERNNQIREIIMKNFFRTILLSLCSDLKSNNILKLWSCN